MIDQETISKLAVRYQTDPLNIWREYFQHLFLSHFYKQPNTDKIYFKGGTALRLIYRSPRFSEDLDFSSSLKSISKIEQAIINALTEIERGGITTKLDEAKQTTGGYLTLIRFRNNGQMIVIKLEISFRAEKRKGELVTIASDFIPPYTMMQLSQKLIVQGKIDALLDRHKPRDFYDLYYLLRANLIDAKQKEILKDALAILKNTDINFNQELKQFLPKDHWAIIRDFKVTLERELERFLG